MGFSQDLLDTHASSWRALTGHQFFREVEAGSLPESSRDAYFVYERAFVDQAVVVFSHLLAGAPDLQARRKIVSILNGLVHDQVDIFDEIFARCRLESRSPEKGRWPGPVQALCDGMTDIARTEDYAAGLAAVFVAERSYLDVSRRIGRADITDAALHKWFQLHTQQPFVDGVEWLAREIDKAGEQGVALDRLASTFGRAIELEIDFHRAPLDVGE